MRRVKYCVGVSLDGYIAAPDGSIDWLERATANAKGEDFGLSAFFETIDTVLMGRKTYEVGVKLGMSKSGYPNVKNYVFSRTLPSGEREGVTFLSASLPTFIAQLQKKPGKDIWLCGGGELARQALVHNLLDQVILGVTPILIGGGLPAFPSQFPESPLKLVECKQYKGGVVGLIYDVLRSAGKKTASRKAAKTKKR